MEESTAGGHPQRPDPSDGDDDPTPEGASTEDRRAADTSDVGSPPGVGAPHPDEPPASHSVDESIVRDHDWWDEHAPLIGDHPPGIGYATPESAVWNLPHPLPGDHGGADPGYPYDAAGFDPIVLGDFRSRPRRLGVVVAGLVGAAAALGGAWVLGAFDDPPPPEVIAQVAPVAQPTINVTGDTSEVAVAVAARVTPSIVSVEVGDGGFDNEFVPLVSGSGVVIDDGIIVTNHHVVSEGDTVRVVLQDGSIHEATLRGSDDETDLAVLAVDVAGLLPVALGDTGDLTIGETAIAIGNPLGLSGGASLTVGVLSAFGRQIDTDVDSSLFGMLQTDAPITEGSSGGALVDGDGDLIGITTAIGVSSAGAEGIGFAVPVELMQRITAEIIETGRVRHAYLGVDLRNQLSERGDGALVPTGALIAAFPQGEESVAEAAGMRRGDVIVSLNGRPVTTREALISDLRMLSAGDVATIEVDRDGDVVEFELELAQRPVNP